MKLKRNTGFPFPKYLIGMKAIVVLCNFIPALGVLFWGWKVEYFIILYWLETLIIGIFYLAKITARIIYVYFNYDYENDLEECLKKKERADSSYLWLKEILVIPVFILSFGAFCIFHGIFIIAIFGKSLGLWPEVAFPTLHMVPKIVFLFKPKLIMMSAFLAIIQGTDFFRQFLNRKEFEQKDALKLMNEPYSRIIVLQFTVISSSYFFIHFSVKDNLIACAIIILKTGLDLILDYYPDLDFAGRFKYPWRK